MAKPNRITNPSPYQIVKVLDKQNGNYDAMIVNGQYYSNGRLSNFWYWRRISADGFLSDEVECGYGNFVESKNRYKVNVNITIEKQK